MSDHINKYDYVRFSVADMHGRSRGRVVPARHVKRYLKKGVTLFAGALSFDLNNEDTIIPSPLLKDGRQPKVYAHPDLNTLYNVSWSGKDDVLVAEVICESYWLKDGSAQQACPRYVARQQLERLASSGYSFFSGFELEFTLTKVENTLSLQKGYGSQRFVSKHSDFLFYFDKHMSQAGVDIDSFHSEYAGSSIEMVKRPYDGIKSADSCVVLKNGILEMGDKKDYRISFDAKQESGTVGMHFNHSLWSLSKGINIFHNPDGLHGLSTLGKHWLGGLMKHAKALTALWCPTANCYDRLHEPDRPGLIFWSNDIGAACFKVKSLETGTYLENRIPSGMSNPYITLAATIAAGLDGIVKKLECPPVDQSSSCALPCTLSEAIKELQGDTDMVNSLGKEFIEWFVCTIKTDIESNVV
ncbi:lengsin-like [Haliotis rufescens]|uniref:lengsin-like n=1 Tax=Haliotis rufescens TaxID=6454 RepID=UPI00201FA5A2|nr:lengsin-like [Haliotis rufescens]